MKLILITTLIGHLTTTSYRSVPEQTDSSPFITSTGEKVSPDGVAVSQDLLKKGVVKYGDWIFIERIGLKRVNDTMHPRHKNHVDVWVGSYGKEKEFDKKFRGQKLRVYLVKEHKKEKHK